MSDVFVSYARSTEKQAQQVADAIRALGYKVWRDDELPAHRSYSEVIEERIRTAKAVLVLWSSDAVRSQWVRAEADAAREAGTLVQVSLDGVLPPMPFNQIQCADLNGWSGETGTPGWRKVESSIATLAGGGSPDAAQSEAARPARRVAICVVPFVNMSGDPEQEYFSDGISEDIIIDLSKVSALTTIPRNAAFALKGKPVDLVAIARDLGATHVLEGSVRKAGSRVRITAELIDSSNEQLWAERYDRDLTDIFAIQDEISKAIVAALKLKLLPKEKKAIEHRGTSSPEAYNLYLMARQHWISGNRGDTRREEVVIRICLQAIAIDAQYAKAWALMALAQSELRFWHGRLDIDGLEAAERALELDPELPDALCVKARYLLEDGRHSEANHQIEAALRLDPESWEVNKEAAFLTFRQGRIRDSIPYFEKASALMDTDYHDAAMLITCYESIGDLEATRKAAQVTLSRVEKALAQDPGNGFALGKGGTCHAVLGNKERAKEWLQRAMLIDPGNWSMVYNVACVYTTHLDDFEGALDLLERLMGTASATQLAHCQADPDLDPLRDNPRFEALIAAATERLAGSKSVAA